MTTPIRAVGRLAAAVLVTFLALVAFAGMASATTLQETVPDTPGLTIPEVGVSILVGLFLPIVYGFLVRPSNPELVKVVGGVIIAASASLVVNAIQNDGTAVLSWQQVVDVALVYIPQIAGYLGVWKPLEINERTGPGIAIGRGSA